MIWSILVYFLFFPILCSSLIFTPQSQILHHYPLYIFFLPYSILFHHIWVEGMSCTIKEGVGMWGWVRKEICFCGWSRNYFGVQFIAPILFPNLTPSMAPCPARDLGGELYIMREYDIATVIEVQLFTQQRMYNMGPSIFAATSRLKFVSMTSDSFPSVPSTNWTNGEKWFHC